MIKIIALAALVLFSAPSVARAGDAAYYDPTKVATECAACKAEAKAVAADVKTWQTEVDKLEAAAKTADEACAKDHTAGARQPAPCADAATKHQGAQQQIAKYQAQVNKREADSRAKTQARVLAILPAIAKARRLAAIIPVAGAFYAAPAVDLTAEIMQRLDAGEGKANDELRAENEKLKAENAKLKAKPEAAKK